MSERSKNEPILIFGIFAEGVRMVACIDASQYPSSPTQQADFIRSLQANHDTPSLFGAQGKTPLFSSLAVG